jgi:phosphatidylinositol-3-phosphatase
MASSPGAKGQGGGAGSGGTGTRAHVMVLVLENREASSVINNPSAPYIRSLASRYGLATQSYGMSHPSLPNYLTLIGGSTFGITSDCTDCSVGSAPSLVDQLEAAGIGWKAYMEGMPYPCYLGATSPAGYAKRHDPFLYFTRIVSNPSRCNRVVPYSQLSVDLASGTAPPFLWVTPNVCHDGHDCPTSTTDSWLASNLPPVLASAWYRSGGAVIVTWDEGETDASCCNGNANGGHIVTIVISGRTPRGARSSTPVDHAGTLATIEDQLGLSHLNGAKDPANGNLLSLL